MDTSSQVGEIRPGITTRTSTVDGSVEMYIGPRTAAGEITRALTWYVSAGARLDEDEPLTLRFTRPQP